MRNKKLPSKRHNLSPGDVVLVGSDNTKCLNCPLGRVIELFQDKGNTERVAKLRAANGEIIRPIQRIYLLEISSTEISKSVPENIESVSDITDNCLHTVSNERSSQADAHQKEQSQTVKKIRCGRRIVPVKRLDL
ncbi:hypothetical protein AVEN_264607-1 [Araneus ventricosus]|uniref:DUF5641 domain-containing protein n=1 Tax=Araneus ventricosus TaxID=182803 RepID=A0A4Y2FSQ3_ARAVE|nr:hypothetical protein AVEN_264607-1 [Araneus ventricosus]